MSIASAVRKQSFLDTPPPSRKWDATVASREKTASAIQSAGQTVAAPANRTFISEYTMPSAKRDIRFAANIHYRLKIPDYLGQADITITGGIFDSIELPDASLINGSYILRQAGQDVILEIGKNNRIIFKNPAKLPDVQRIDSRNFDLTDFKEFTTKFSLMSVAVKQFGDQLVAKYAKDHALPFATADQKKAASIAYTRATSELEQMNALSNAIRSSYYSTSFVNLSDLAKKIARYDADKLSVIIAKDPDFLSQYELVRKMVEPPGPISYSMQRELTAIVNKINEHNLVMASRSVVNLASSVAQLPKSGALSARQQDQVATLRNLLNAASDIDAQGEVDVKADAIRKKMKDVLNIVFLRGSVAAARAVDALKACATFAHATGTTTLAEVDAKIKAITDVREVANILKSQNITPEVFAVFFKKTVVISFGVALATDFISLATGTFYHNRKDIGPNILALVGHLAYATRIQTLWDSAIAAEKKISSIKNVVTTTENLRNIVGGAETGVENVTASEIEMREIARAVEGLGGTPEQVRQRVASIAARAEPGVSTQTVLANTRVVTTETGAEAVVDLANAANEGGEVLTSAQRASRIAVTGETIATATAQAAKFNSLRLAFGIGDIAIGASQVWKGHNDYVDGRKKTGNLKFYSGTFNIASGVLLCMAAFSAAPALAAAAAACTVVGLGLNLATLWVKD